jgi:hypothetical protein
MMPVTNVTIGIATAFPGNSCMCSPDALTLSIKADPSPDHEWILALFYGTWSGIAVTKGASSALDIVFQFFSTKFSIVLGTASPLAATCSSLFAVAEAIPAGRDLWKSVKKSGECRRVQALHQQKRGEFIEEWRIRKREIDAHHTELNRLHTLEAPSQTELDNKENIKKKIDDLLKEDLNAYLKVESAIAQYSSLSTQQTGHTIAFIRDAVVQSGGAACAIPNSLASLHAIASIPWLAWLTPVFSAAMALLHLASGIHGLLTTRSAKVRAKAAYAMAKSLPKASANIREDFRALLKAAKPLPPAASQADHARHARYDGLLHGASEDDLAVISGVVKALRLHAKRNHKTEFGACDKKRRTHLLRICYSVLAGAIAGLSIALALGAIAFPPLGLILLLASAVLSGLWLYYARARNKDKAEALLKTQSENNAAKTEAVAHIRDRCAAEQPLDDEQAAINKYVALAAIVGNLCDADPCRRKLAKAALMQLSAPKEAISALKANRRYGGEHDDAASLHQLIHDAVLGESARAERPARPTPPEQRRCFP